MSSKYHAATPHYAFFFKPEDSVLSSDARIRERILTLKSSFIFRPAAEEKLEKSNDLNALNSLNDLNASKLIPRAARNRGDQLQFALHVVPGNEIAGSSRRKTALGADGEIFHRHVLRSLFDASKDLIFGF